MNSKGNYITNSFLITFCDVYKVVIKQEVFKFAIFVESISNILEEFCTNDTLKMHRKFQKNCALSMVY